MTVEVLALVAFTETFLTCVSILLFEASCSFLEWHRHFLHCIDRDNSARRGILGDILTTQTKNKTQKKNIAKAKKGCGAFATVTA